MFREVTVDRPNVPTLLSSALIRGDQIVATRGPFIFSLISCPFFWRGVNRRQERGHLTSEHIKGPLVATIRSPLVKALDRSVGTLGLWNVTSWLYFLNLQTRVASNHVIFMPGSYERKNKKLAKHISPSGKVKCSNPEAHNLIQIPVAGDGLQKSKS